MIHSFFKNENHQLNMARDWKIGKYILAQTKIVTKLNIFFITVYCLLYYCYNKSSYNNKNPKHFAYFLCYLMRCLLRLKDRHNIIRLK